MLTGKTTQPPPAAVWENDWRQIALPPPEEFVPREKVSVIVPYYNAPDELAVALQALEQQTYPRELLEIIIAADYPDPTLDESGLPAGVRVFRQPHEGFGAGRARNMGARQAAGSILVFFDGDIVPAPGCVAAHARWHHQASNLVTIGDRGFVARDAITAERLPRVLDELADGSSNIPVEQSHHRNLIDLTDEFAAGGDTIYQAVIGHNFGIRRSAYLDLGGNRDDAKHWGFEDTELGFRAYTRGMVIVFAKDALTWHLGPQDYLRNPAKVRGHRLQSALMEHYIADYRFRDAAPGRSFAVPECIVNVSSPDPLLAMEIAMDVLADPPHDLAVRIDLHGDDGDSATIARRRLSGDPRVKFGAFNDSLDDFPNSPLHLYLRTNQRPRRRIVRKMRKLLGSRAMVSATSQDGMVAMARSWAAHRANLCQCRIGDVGSVRLVPWSRVVGKSAGKPRYRRISSSGRDRTLKLLERVRTPGDLMRLAVHRLRSLNIRR